MPPVITPKPKPKPKPIETLPLYTYNRATDKNVAKDSTVDSLLK